MTCKKVSGLHIKLVRNESIKILINLLFMFVLDPQKTLNKVFWKYLVWWTLLYVTSWASPSSYNTGSMCLSMIVGIPFVFIFISHSVSGTAGNIKIHHPRDTLVLLYRLGKKPFFVNSEFWNTDLAEKTRKLRQIWNRNKTA